MRGTARSKRRGCLALGVIAAAQAPEFADWGLTLLAGQLRDRDERVKAAALTELLEVCEAPEMLHALPKALVSARLDVDELPALVHRLAQNQPERLQMLRLHPTACIVTMYFL